ncbi:MAG: Photosynthesis system assembly factor, partial [Thermoleophilia bacterium]|nr:Photosynthesis system assembly factor [Thermoleophilia bacterium]
MTAMSPGASAPVVVSMDIPSAISMTNGCTGSPATALGTVQPGTPATTATGAGACSIDWTSTNDSSMLRIGQRDGIGAAMSKPTAIGGYTDWAIYTAVDTEDGTNAVAVGSGGRYAYSTDSGATWSATNAMGGNSNEATEVEQVPGAPATSWMAGYGGRLQRVTGGFTAPVATNFYANLVAGGWPTGTDAFSIGVVDANTVFVGGPDGWFAKTVNGGTNWTVFQ